MEVRQVTFELREDTAAAWTSVNPTLRAGEPGFERDTNKLKIGDGITPWTSLSYLVGSGGGGAVDSVFGRTGVITAQTGDYTKAQVGLGSVDNTSDAAKPVSTATATALAGKADLVSGSVPYSQLPLLAFRGDWAAATTYETGDTVMFSDSLFGTANGAAADVEPFTSTKLLTGTPSSTDSSDFEEYEFFSYFDVSTRIRMTGITFRKVATQTEVPITVRLWDRDVSLTTPLFVTTVTPLFNFAGEVIAPVLWDLVPGKNYAVSFTLGLGSGFGYVYTPAFSFPLTVGDVTLRNSGFTQTEGTLTSPTLGTLFWVGIQWQAVNTGWTRLANLDPPAGAKGAKGDPGTAGATGPTGPAGEVYPLSALGFVAASIDPIDAGTISSTGPWVARVWVPPNQAITKVGCYVATVGVAGNTLNAFAIYDASGNLVTQTANNNNLWTTGGWTLENLPSTIAAQSTGRFVFVAMALNGSSPDILYHQAQGSSIVNGIVSGHRRAWVGPSRNAGFPSSINVATEGTEFPYIPLFVLA